MKLTYNIRQGVEIAFDGIPPSDIRSALKANGFRWLPSCGFWFRQRASGAADLIEWIERQLNPTQNTAPCWDCKQPGRFRGYGAATPVYCDACEAKHREAEKQHQPWKHHETTS